MSFQTRRSDLPGTLTLITLFLTGTMAPELGARELPPCSATIFCKQTTASAFRLGTGYRRGNLGSIDRIAGIEPAVGGGRVMAPALVLSTLQTRRP